MNIAHIIPRSVTYPLKSPNGRYEWVRQLALQQVSQGHTVTIYGNPDSHISSIVCTGTPTAQTTQEQTNVETFRFAFSHEHDIYHSHFDSLHYEVAHETAKPIVFTQHWWPNERTVELAKTRNARNVWAVPPTRFMYDYDRESGIQSKGTIYHGIDLTTFHSTYAEKNGRLLFVGRISPEKNLPIAIETAKTTGTGLDIVGKVTPKNRSYWQSLQGDIDGIHIRYLSSKNQTELVELYSAALGVFCPFEPTEAFGLVAIEAQACGTPVIMKRGGSRHELLDEGKSGFLCETDDEFIAAVTQLRSLQAEDCIDFATKFSITTMVAAYDSLYAELI